jgi:hypothetical protein
MKKLNKTKTLLTLTLTILLQACSTTSSVGTGAGIGAGLGAGVGAIADGGPNGQNRFRNVVIGSAAGALLGAGAGLALDHHDHDEREDAKKEGAKDAEELMKKNQAVYSAAGLQPTLIPPKTEAKWIPDQVKGSTFVPGHFEYLIVAPAHWEN